MDPKIVHPRVTAHRVWLRVLCFPVLQLSHMFLRRTHVNTVGVVVSTTEKVTAAHGGCLFSAAVRCHSSDTRKQIQLVLCFSPSSIYAVCKRPPVVYKIAVKPCCVTRTTRCGSVCSRSITPRRSMTGKKTCLSFSFVRYSFLPATILSC